jgi:hypothetical protein
MKIPIRIFLKSTIESFKKSEKKICDVVNGGLYQCAKNQ